jgi:polyisoprenoid-binding protein YceI
VRTLHATAILIMLGAGPTVAEAPQWIVDDKNSRITFTAKQMQVPVAGRFKKFTATIHFDPDDLSGSKASIDIDVASVSTPNPDIESEIKRSPWFDVEHFPIARFVTTGIRARGDKAYEAMASLTIRDVTKEVVLPFTVDISPDPGDSNVLVAHATGEVTVSRLAFGIGRGEWKATSVVADSVVIHIDVVSRRKK